MPEPAQRTSYVAAVLAAYRRTPGTLATIRPADRRLAAALFDAGVPLAVVETALLLAAARRANCASGGPPLGPIRSLHYFKPVIDELLDHPPDPAYVTYLLMTLERWREPNPTPSPTTA
jgi:hypothetical protein